MPKPDPTEIESFRHRLERACEGLNFVSETDSNVTPFFGRAPTSASTSDVLTAIGVSAATTVAVADFEKFFSRLTSNKEWFGESQRTNAARFKVLKQVLRSELDDLKVFRVGKIHITIYVVGLDHEGRTAGVKTYAIET